MAINFPTSLDSFSSKTDNVDDVMAVDINDLQDAIEALEAKVGINSSAVTASLDYKVNNFFATGRKLWLYENTAPTGWSIVAVTDRVLATKGGSNAYNTTGGTSAGTWTQPNHTHTGPNHRHTGYDHVHKWYESNSGSHDQSHNSSGVATNLDSLTILDDKNGLGKVILPDTPSEDAQTHFDDLYTSEEGSGSYTGYSGTGATGGGATAATWRPYAAVGIIVTKA